MTIHSFGFAPNSSPSLDEDYRIYANNLPLLLRNSQLIQSKSEWKSIELPFAWCSWPYVSGDGPLALGILLEGYQNGLLIEPCPTCTEDCFVTVFSGSPLSGSNSWSGYCLSCNQAKRAKESIHKPFVKRLRFVSDLRRTMGKTPHSLKDLLVFLAADEEI